MSDPPSPSHDSLPPPPSGSNPNEMRGTLMKEETRLGRKSWKDKYVIANDQTLKYFATSSPDFTKERPRKNLPVAGLVLSKLQKAYKHYRDHSFRVASGDYEMIFSAKDDAERDAWMAFLERVGGSRKRMDTLIEEEVGKIKDEVGSRDSTLGVQDLTLAGAEKAARDQITWGTVPPHPPTVQTRKLSGPPPADEKFPTVSAAANNRRTFASRVYDLFIKGASPAVLSTDLEKLILHLALDSSAKTEDILAIVDPVKTGYVQKDLFLSWYENDESSKRSYSPTVIQSVPGGPGSPVLKQFTKKTPMNKVVASPRPKMDVSRTVNLLKFSNTPMSIHMLQTELCKSINVTLVNKEWWKMTDESTKLIEPLARVIGKVRLTEVAESRGRDGDGDEHMYVREEPLVDLMVLLVRFIKHCVVGAEHASALFASEHVFDHHLVALFEHPPSPSWNKLRVATAKLFLHLCENYPESLSKYIIRSIVEVAGSPDDQLKVVALECLRYLILTRIECVSRCNGIKVAFEAILDTSTKEMAAPLMYAILHVASSPDTRKYLRANVFSPLFASFTDLDAESGSERTAKWKCSQRALVIALRTFTGVLMLASRPSYIPSLLGLVSDDTVEHAVQIKVLEVISSVLEPCKQLNENMVKFKAKTKLANPKSPRQSIMQSKNHHDDDAGYKINMIDFYTTTLCNAFVHCDLVRSLTNLCVHDNFEVSHLALKLLADFMVICSRVLPKSRVEELLSMPQLTYCATRVGNGSVKAEEQGDDKADRSVDAKREGEEKKNDTHGIKDMLKVLEKGTKASAALRSLANALGEGDGGSKGKEIDTNNPCVGTVVGLLRVSGLTSGMGEAVEGIGRKGRIMESLKQGLETGLDKRMLANLLEKSQVQESKDWHKWNWMTIQEILEDSLQNKERLSDALKGKFVKRLGGYFRCSPDEKGFFAHLVWQPTNIVYMNCACKFYETLLKHQDGQQFLKSDRRGKVFEEIAKELTVAIKHVESQSNEGMPAAPKSQVFDRDTTHRHMTREYFAILGRIWCSKAGESLLDETLGLKIYDLFMSLAKHQPLDYLSRIVLSNLDYNNSARPQLLLQSYIENSPSVTLRLHAIQVLRTIVRSRVDDFQWGIEILITRLQFQDAVVNEVVLSVLNEAAAYKPYLKEIIKKRPHFIPHPLADSLFEKFASVKEGIDFLTTQNKKWFEKSIFAWKNERSTQYVVEVENAIADSLISSGKLDSGMPPLKIPLSAKRSVALQAHQERFAGKEMDLESLLRIPWTIDLVVNQSKRNAAAQGMAVTLDTTLRATKDINCVIVTGTYVDAQGRNDLLRCSLQDCIHSSLFVGSCPVKKDGRVGEPLKMWQQHSFTPSSDNLAAAFGVADRSSLSSPIKAGRGRSVSSESSASSRFGGSGPDVDSDVAACDWTTCFFQSGQGRFIKEYDGNDVKVSVPGEPAVFYFKQEHEEGGTSKLALRKVEYTLCLSPRKNAVRPPNHLFGELAKTEAGCEVLKQHRVVTELAEVVRGGLEAEENAGEFLGSLWSLANICSAEDGLDLVKSIYGDFVHWLCKTAGAPGGDFSMRGTCLCLLGLVASTVEGRQTIEEYGWVCPDDPYSPKCPMPDIDDGFFGSWMEKGGAFMGSPSRAGEDGGDVAGGSIISKDREAAAIFNAIGKLGDHITQKEGMAALRKMRADKALAKCWSQDEVVGEIHRMMATMKLGLACRRFVRLELLLEGEV